MLDLVFEEPREPTNGEAPRVRQHKDDALALAGAALLRVRALTDVCDPARVAARHLDGDDLVFFTAECVETSREEALEIGSYVAGVIADDEVRHDIHRG